MVHILKRTTREHLKLSILVNNDKEIVAVEDNALPHGPNLQVNAMHQIKNKKL
jgi:hypothetical protein